MWGAVRHKILPTKKFLSPANLFLLPHRATAAPAALFSPASSPSPTSTPHFHDRTNRPSLVVIAPQPPSVHVTRAHPHWHFRSFGDLYPVVARVNMLPRRSPNDSAKGLSLSCYKVSASSNEELCVKLREIHILRPGAQCSYNVVVVPSPRAT